MASTSKVCTKCGERKKPSEFYASKSCVDGKRGDCKKCHIKVAIEWGKTEVGKASRKKADKKYSQKM